MKFVHDMKNYLGIVIGYSNLLLEEPEVFGHLWHVVQSYTHIKIRR